MLIFTFDSALFLYLSLFYFRQKEFKNVFRYVIFILAISVWILFVLIISL